MKMNFLRLVLSAMICLFAATSFGQGTNCATATPFCSNGLNPYPAGVNNPAAPVGNNYDCLFTQPNPAWFYINITQNGDLDFTLDNTNSEDIDFILYGPFPNLGAALTQCGGLGNGGASGGVAACSYSGAAVEPVQVAGVVAGQVYILMVTNFSNQPTNIFATPNSGSGDYACDCETNILYGLAPVPFNDAVVLDTTSTDIEFAVCAGGQVGFTIDVRADSIVDSLGIYLPNTNIGNIFGPANVSVFGPVYPISGRYDTANFVVFIRTDSTNVGINNAVLSILNSGCVQDLNIRVNVIGIAANTADTSICAGIAQNVQLTSATTALAGGDYQWTQLSGPPCVISNDTIASPIISVPNTTTAGDSIVFSVSFQSVADSVTGLSCLSTDRVIIYLVATPLGVDLMASDYSLCQNGLANSVQFNTTVSGPSIDSTGGVYAWTSNPAGYVGSLSATNIGNPLGQISGTPGSTVQYFVAYNYGLCVGRDTVTLTFGNWVADVTPAADTICPGDTVTLTASPGASVCSPTYLVSSIPFAPLTGTGISTGLACDDCMSNALPIGFNFDFFCNTYTQFEASSNGFITFDLGNFNPGCCSGQSLPDPFDPSNLISLAWEDLNVGSCGSVTYFTTGTIPNRRLVVNYDAVCFFGSTLTITAQVILYETTNVIEIHTTNIPSNFSIMTQGIENVGGTAGFPVPGHNAADFTSTNEAWRFTPQLTFLPAYTWSPNSSASTQVVQVHPNANTTYIVSVTEGGCTMVDSAVISISSPLLAPVVSCDTVTNNSVTFIWSTVAGAVNYEYSLDNGATWTAINNTTFTVSGLGQGVSASILVRGVAASGTCIYGPAAGQTCTTTTSCNNPNGATLNFDNTLCNGSNSFVVVTSLAGGTGPFAFDLGGGLIDTAFAVGDTIFRGLVAGSYQATLIDLSTGCSSSGTIPVTILNLGQNVTINIVETAQIQCGSNTGAALNVNTVAGNPVTYLWNNGATTAAISGLAAGQYIVTATNANGSCFGLDTILVTGPLTPTLNAWVGQLGQDSTCIIKGEVATISAGANEAGVTYLWSPSTDVAHIDSALTQITGNTVGSTVYTITATSVDGCVTTDQIILCVSPTSFGGMPTAFTPDGDGKNDRLFPVELIGATVSRFEVYNRWGQKVFDNPNADSSTGWNGTIGGVDQPRDVYMYILVYKFPADAEPTTLRGAVTLLR